MTDTIQMPASIKLFFAKIDTWAHAQVMKI